MQCSKVDVEIFKDYLSNNNVDIFLDDERLKSRKIDLKTTVTLPTTDYLAIKTDKKRIKVAHIYKLEQGKYAGIWKNKCYYFVAKVVQ